MEDIINVEELKSDLRAFAKARDWEQFHSPKNLATSLSIECSELLEIFQWINEESSRSIMNDPSKAVQVREELADVFYYLIRISDILKVDLESALKDKMKKNAEKYPVDLSKGNAKKYTELKP